MLSRNCNSEPAKPVAILGRNAFLSMLVSELGGHIPAFRELGYESREEWDDVQKLRIDATLYENDIQLAAETFDGLHNLDSLYTAYITWYLARDLCVRVYEI